MASDAVQPMSSAEPVVLLTTPSTSSSSSSTHDSHDATTTTILSLPHETSTTVHSPVISVTPDLTQPSTNDNDPPKLKGRQRLLMGLQRISSSPSLALLRGHAGNASSSALINGQHGRNRGAVSCVSLASPFSSPASPHEAPSLSSSPTPSHTSSDGPASPSTAPTSIAGTPGAEMGFFDGNLHSRRNARNHAPGPLTTWSPAPTKVGLPSEVCVTVEGLTRPSTPATLDAATETEGTVENEPPREPFDFWKNMPHEIQIGVLRLLAPKEIVRCSAVSKFWHRMCFDGQLWSTLDASEFYKDIPSDAVVQILTQAGPFVRDLNLRGCVQMRERWPQDSGRISAACRNLETFSLEGCRIDRGSVHAFLLRNPRLVSVNLSGLATVSNAALNILAQTCPRLEHLDVSWCPHIDAAGLHAVVRACPSLRDLRAAEIQGWGERPELLIDLFQRNTLERLIAAHCNDFDDRSLLLLLQGPNPEFDVLTPGRALVPARRLKHLDLGRCRALGDRSVAALAYHVPSLVGLRLSQCHHLTDGAVLDIFAAATRLTHLDLEELALTNAVLHGLARSPSAPYLRHLNVSYCENLGDTGMLAVLKACPLLKALEMDNTRVSDLTLAEIAAQVRARNLRATTPNTTGRPQLGLRVVAYDCPHVTWTGVREILSRNAEFFHRPVGSTAPTYPKEVVALKCFYGYQQTVAEHTRRVLKGELARATLLERRWADWLVANEEAEAGGGGAGWRRRRRRAREAERAHADEAEELGRGGRRRARSGGCIVM